MKAMQILVPGEASFIELPTPVAGDNDVLIRVHLIGYCGSDLNAYRGMSPMAKFPLIPGHEICGEIVSVGKQVPVGYRAGAIVTVKPYFNCGDCISCRSQRPNACRFNQTLGVQRDGALCEMIAVDYTHVIVCKGLEEETVTLIEPLSVGYHLANRGRIHEGEFAAVIGCGAVGLGAVAAAAHQKAHVIAVDIADEKLELARGLGAEFVINSSQENPIKRILEITGGDGVAVALEAAGTEKTCQLAVEATAFSGRVGIVSYAKAPVCFDTKLFVSKELDIMGSRNALGEFSGVIEMARKKERELRRMVTRVYHFSEAIQALKDWEAHPERITKLMIRLV